MRLPSVKTLRAVFGDKAKEARRILEMSRAELETLPAGAARVRECYHPPRTWDVRLHCLDALGETYGLEAFETTKRDTWGAGSPMWCNYLNAGDTYAPTVIYFGGRYRVAAWGDIAERWT
jgi:hypothetical protein